MVDPKFVQISTPDGLTLPGLFYEAPRSKKVIINLHGNGSSSVFYQGDTTFHFANNLVNAGISFLTFNNRGAHYIKTLRKVEKDVVIERKRFGMSYELIQECVYDIDGAISFLKKQGYSEYILLGFSTGANKICVYDHYKSRNKISHYIMVGGGDDTGLYYDALGKKQFSRLLNEAEQKITNGQGDDIICELLPEDIFSYQSFYDLANPDGDYNTFPFLEAMGRAKLSTKPLFRYFKSLKKSTLVIYGGADEFQYGDVPRVVEILKEQRPDFTYEIIQDADHSISEHKKELAKILLNWLR